jgi:dCMP deaminase
MRPSRSQTLLDVAALIARRSTCNRLSVGAVVAREGRILTTGYNGPPSGMPHCDHPPGEVIRKYINLTAKDTGSCTAAVHAERNALAFAARYGMATDGAELFVTHSPCLNCAQSIIQAGIVMVYYGLEFRDLSGLDLLEAAGVETHYGPA